MGKFLYIWAKLLKKLRGSSITESQIPGTSKVESGSNIVATTFGEHSFCGYNCEINNCDIGSFCSIANYVVIGGGMHPMEWVGMSPVFYEGRDSVKAKFSEHKRKISKRTSIGNDVWIGHGVKIKAGVKIGHGAVIGMGSIVTKDIEPYAIVAGNPARLLRYRFEKRIVEALLKSQWWNYTDEKLKSVAVLFKDPVKFLESEGLL